MTAPSIKPTEVATASTAAANTPAAAFNARLASMHGPTTNLASTMRTLTPFPAVASLTDASVLDLHVSLSRPALDGSIECGPIDAHVKARYATAASASEAIAFYGNELDSAITSVTDASGGAAARIEGTVSAGRYCARVFDLGFATTVIVQSQSHHEPDAVPFASLVEWHGLDRLDGAIADRVEVFTVAAGRHSPIQAIYSTEYHFPGMSTRAVRSSVDELLLRQGWAATESFENSMLFDATFEGEAHIAGHDGAATLTVVGEFPLPSTPSPPTRWRP